MHFMALKKSRKHSGFRERRDEVESLTFFAWDDFLARSRFARSAIPKENNKRSPKGA